jgi:hypothetical protein
MVETKLIKIRDFLSFLTAIMIVFPKMATSGTPPVHKTANNPDPCASRQEMYKGIIADIIIA